MAVNVDTQFSPAPPHKSTPIKRFIPLFITLFPPCLPRLRERTLFLPEVGWVMTKISRLIVIGEGGEFLLPYFEGGGVYALFL